MKNNVEVSHYLKPRLSQASALNLSRPPRFHKNVRSVIIRKPRVKTTVYFSYVLANNNMKPIRVKRPWLPNILLFFVMNNCERHVENITVSSKTQRSCFEVSRLTVRKVKLYNTDETLVPHVVIKMYEIIGLTWQIC